MGMLKARVELVVERDGRDERQKANLNSLGTWARILKEDNTIPWSQMRLPKWLRVGILRASPPAFSCIRCQANKMTPQQQNIPIEVPDHGRAYSAVIYPYVDKALLHVQSAKGVYLRLADGREILDGASGAMVSCIDYNDERISKSLQDAMQSVSYAHAQVYTAGPVEELARWLVESTGGALQRVMFGSSGKEQTDRSKAKADW